MYVYRCININSDKAAIVTFFLSNKIKNNIHKAGITQLTKKKRTVSKYHFWHQFLSKYSFDANIQQDQMSTSPTF
jgi:hypothetical protein